MFNIFGKFKKEKEVDDNIDISGVDTVKSKLITYPHGFSTRNGGVSQGILRGKSGDFFVIKPGYEQGR